MLKSQKFGVFCSYIMILLNTVSNIALVPFYLHHLGIDGYGFYQMIYSVASYILVLDFGIGTTMVRFITEYRTTNNKTDEENFAAHGLGFVCVVSCFIFVLGCMIAFNIGNIYLGLSSNKVELAQHMLFILIFVLISNVFEHYFEGVVIAYDSFSVTKILGCLKLLLRFAMIVSFLNFGFGAIGLVYVDAIAQLVVILIYNYYVFKILNFKIKFYKYNANMLKATSTFMLAIVIQSIVAYFNNTVDKTLLGIMLGETASAIYSLALSFIVMYNMIPTSILTIFLPIATKMVISGESMYKHSMLAIKIGRYQMLVCGAILSGFIVCGKDFIYLWAKIYVEEIWLTAIIIMIPNSVPLIQNYCLNVLDAMNKRMFRSLALLGMSVLNLVATIYMVKSYGLIGAPIATAVSYILGYGILINYYYNNYIGLDIFFIWRGICNKLLPAILLATLLSYPLTVWPSNNWIVFALKVFCWLSVYVFIILKIGLDKDEVNILYYMCRKVKNKITE